MTAVELPPDVPGPWGAVAELVEVLPAGWVLIGGLMVQLHALQRGVGEVRATVDVDVLGQARPQGALQAIDSALTAAGFRAAPPDPDGYAHRYERDEAIVDVPRTGSPRCSTGPARRSECRVARRPSGEPRR